MVNLDFKAYIMPRQDKWDSPEEFRRAGLIRRWNASQGIYVYRLDRLVKAGGWFRFRSNDEHCKLSRISLDIDRAADDALNLNIQKSTIMIPTDIRRVIKDWVGDRANRARNVYDFDRLEKTRKARPFKKGKRAVSGKGKRTAVKNAKEAIVKKPSASGKAVLLYLWEKCDSDVDRRALVRVCKRAYPGFRFDG